MTSCRKLKALDQSSYPIELILDGLLLSMDSMIWLPGTIYFSNLLLYSVESGHILLI